MGRGLRLARWTTVLGLVAAVVGLVVLLAQAMSEVMANPELSLEDGYWIGRLPWTVVGVDLAVIGGTVAVASGTIAAWLAGGPIRRAVSALALAVAGCWWLLAMLPPPQGAFCAACPPPGPEPFTIAYSLPQAAALFLLLPAVVAGMVALATRRGGYGAAAG